MVVEDEASGEKQPEFTHQPEVSSEIGRLLSIRRSLKARKPTFRRQESWRYGRVHPSWRRPRGIDSKMRRKLRGRPKNVEVGYRSPKKVRGLDGLGRRERLVSNVSQLSEMSQAEVVRVSGKVGRRKRLAILEKAAELSLHVINSRRVSEPES